MSNGQTFMISYFENIVNLILKGTTQDELSKSGFDRKILEGISRLLNYWIKQGVIKK